MRATPRKGRGVFATRPIPAGTLLVEIQGWLARSEELDDAWFAMQVGPDQWLCSDGAALDDCINHSCDPNAGFATGEPALYSLRDIGPGEEIAWDYSTSIAEAGWTLTCRCEALTCRRVVRSWPELTPTQRQRLRAIALRYLREMECPSGPS